MTDKQDEQQCYDVTLSLCNACYFCGVGKVLVH